MEVGVFAGWGRGALYGETAWDTNKQNAITSCVKSGQRRVYKPPPIGGMVHEWSWLKPVATRRLASGESVLEMPDDFGSISGLITVLSDETMMCELRVGGIGGVTASHAAFPESSGRPEKAALRWKKMQNETQGQRQELVVYPTLGADYTFEFQYELLPNALNGDGAYAYGGMAMAETLKAACKAAYELDYDDIKGGPQDQYFMERLAASIADDRKNKPQHFGYNGNNSDDRWLNRRRFYTDQLVTIGGVTP